MTSTAKKTVSGARTAKSGQSVPPTGSATRQQYSRAGDVADWQRTCGNRAINQWRASRSLAPADSRLVAGLQATVGNRAVANLGKQIPVGAVSDSSEHTANRHAESVTGYRLPRGSPSRPKTIGQSTIESHRGTGRPLPVGVRADFAGILRGRGNGVRIHMDQKADALTRTLNAGAATFERDVFFRSGRFDPKNGPGRALLAHERRREGVTARRGQVSY